VCLCHHRTGCMDVCVSLSVSCVCVCMCVDSWYSVLCLRVSAVGVVGCLRYSAVYATVCVHVRLSVCLKCDNGESLTGESLTV